MTEKNIFAYKRFFPLNISDFNLFFSPSLKVEVLSSPPTLFENLVGGSPRPPTHPPIRKEGGPHYGLSTEFLLHIFNDIYSTSKTFLI